MNLKLNWLPFLITKTGGRPNKEQLPTRIGFQVMGQVVEQPQAIEQAKNSKGKFVLATNELDAISLKVKMFQ